LTDYNSVFIATTLFGSVLTMAELPLVALVSFSFLQLYIISIRANSYWNGFVILSLFYQEKGFTLLILGNHFRIK